MSSVLNIAILWHMHQPSYTDPENPSRLLMPWVRLHALKDYYDMVFILQEFPNLKLNFNLTPVLLEQILGYANGEVTDIHLELTRKPASLLNEYEKIEILQKFFYCNRKTMIEPYPRYAELYLLSGSVRKNLEVANSDKESLLVDIARSWKDQNFLDLQIWSTLCWFDPLVREKDKEIQYLFEKGLGYTEEDKSLLLQKQSEILKNVISEYRKALERGQIEITISPYYHPILPLLINTDVALESMPNVSLPERFVHPEDAVYQIQKGREIIERIFGQKPAGLWPSEGSVSSELISVLSECEINWFAADEAILSSSIGQQIRNGDIITKPKILYSPYEVYNCKKVTGIFRDKVLSDMIGFSYYKWNPLDAAKDFVKRLKGIHEMIGENQGDYLVTIILDGENAWEYYENDGIDFLRGLYGLLESVNYIKAVRISDYLRECPRRERIQKISSGSWINKDFSIWIGTNEDNIAWNHLNATREFVSNSALSKELKDEAMKHIYIAEGSDWFWWYGGEHSSSHLVEFDMLFRKNLIQAYRRLKSEAPPILFEPISKGIREDKPNRMPAGILHPVIDGKPTSFFEWQDAGVYHFKGGTMHGWRGMLKSLYFGFDLENLFLRFDFNYEFINISSLSMTLEILSPNEQMLHVIREGKLEIESKQIEFALLKILEVKIPFYLFGVKPKNSLSFYILLKGEEEEIYPPHTPVRIIVPDREIIDKEWVV